VSLKIQAIVIPVHSLLVHDIGDSEPDTTLVDELESDPNVPFDPNVPPGVPETDERGNLGFDTEEGGPVGNPTSPND
jgi:hypothetical protein